MLDMLRLLILEELAVDETDTIEDGTTVDNDAGDSAQDNEQNETEDTQETFYEIDGEKFTPEQIREWRQGSLRQSDYTRKTQELANQRKQYQEAVELYEYFRNNPHLAQKLAELEEEGEIKNTLVMQNPEIQEMQIKIKAMEIDKELEVLKMKDPDFNEIEVLNLATEEGISINKAYVMWKGQNFDNILKQRLAKQSAELTDNIKKANSSTRTLMNPNDSNNNINFGLSEAQMRMAEKLNMTYEEYKKWM